VFAEAAQVVDRRQVGLLQVAGGLSGGQRQIAEFGGELVGELMVHARDAARSSAIVSARTSTSTSSRPPSAPQPGEREVISTCPGPRGR
jgi:hypothetical protein